MATAPTRAFSATPTVGWASNASSKTSPTFDVQAGDLIVLIAFSEDYSTQLNTPTWTGTGTWSVVQTIEAQNYCTAYIYACTATATQTGRTISLARRNGAGQWSFYASGWRNHGGVGVSGKANVSSGAPALNLTTAANSAVVVGNSDWSANGSSWSWRTVNGSTIIETSRGGTAGVTYMCYSGYVPDTGPAGTNTYGMLTPSTQKYSIVGIEILGTSSAPEVTTSATAPVGLSALGVPSAVHTTAGASAQSRVAASATSTRQAATAALAGLQVGASATSLAEHTSHAFATARLDAAATSSTTRSADANATVSASATATGTSTRQSAGTAPARLAAVGDTTTIHVTAGTAALEIDASATSSASAPHTTTGIASVGTSATAATTTERAVSLSAGLFLEGLANHTTERQTDADAPVGARAEGFTGAYEVHTTTGTADIEASATAATSTTRAGAYTAAVETEAVYTLQAEHRTSSTAPVRTAAFSTTTTVRTLAAPAPIGLSATAHTSNPGAWVDVDLVVSDVAGNPLTVAPPAPGTFTASTPAGHPFTVQPPEA